MGIHTHRDEHYTQEKSFQRNINSGIISQKDREIIDTYIEERTALGGLAESRIKKITSTLIGWQRIFKINSISKITTKVILTGVSDIKKKPLKINNNGAEIYSKNSQHDYIIIGKSFWLWLAENNLTQIDKEKIKKIKVPPVNRNTKDPDDILTKEEIKLLIEYAGNSRNRAIIAILYETGARISELASICWRDVTFDSYGAKIYIKDFKEDQRRFTRVVIGAPYLIEWKNHYIQYGEPSGSNYVFIPIEKTGNEQLQYAGYIKVLKNARKAAKIKKKIHPHLFRTSRITHMIADNYQESIIKLTMWNNLNTDMFQTYVRLHESDIDNELLSHMDVKRKAEVVDELKPITCSRCNFLIAPGLISCPKCGLSINPEIIEEAYSFNPEELADALAFIKNKKSK